MTCSRCRGTRFEPSPSVGLHFCLACGATVNDQGFSLHPTTPRLVKGARVTDTWTHPSQLGAVYTRGPQRRTRW